MSHVHRGPAVHGAHDPRDPHGAVRVDLDFGHFDAHRRAPFGERDAAAATLSEGGRRAPARLRCRKLEGSQVTGLVAQQLAAQLDRVPAGGGRHLVEEALGHEPIV